MNKISKNIVAAFCLIVISCSLISCAHPRKNINPVDPMEPLNRKIFAFNRGVDKVLLRPLAVTYVTIFPKPLQTGVYNALNNIGEITNVGNDLLQGNVKQALADTWRFIINSTVGIGGLFDVAKHVGLKRNDNGFGLTLAKWGVRQSPYVVIPLFGPSTARDALGFATDLYMSPWPYINPISLRYELYGFTTVEYRSRYLGTDQLIDQAFDPYIFVRDAYLQARQQQINQMLHHRPATQEHDLINRAQRLQAKQSSEEQPLVAAPQGNNSQEQPLVAQPLVAAPTKP